MNTRQHTPMDIFIEGWGRMGAEWGVSKVMAEIYALLYLMKEPLTLDDISEKLKTSRSNASLNVRALSDLGVVKKLVIRGERKDYYEAEKDITKVAKLLAMAKKRKELDPAMEIVEAALVAAGESDQPLDDVSNRTVERLQELRRHMDFVNAIFAAFAGGEADASGLANVIRIKDNHQ